MSDLQAKFEAFESQVGTQHTEVIEALNTIITALGAPPPGPTTTLADVVAAIETTNSILASFHSDNNSNLISIFNLLDTINNNNSLNAQRLLAAFYQSMCPCDPTAPVLPPPLSELPLSADDIERCQRIQYFLDIFVGYTIDTGVYVDNTGSISSFQVNNLLQIHLLDLDITTGELRANIPTSTRDSIANTINSGVGTIGAIAVNTGLFEAMTNPDVLEALRQGLYAVDTAAAGIPAFNDALDSIPGIDSTTQGILSALFYSGWANDIYSDVPEVDASMYDGEVCAPPVEPTGPVLLWSGASVLLTKTTDDGLAESLTGLMPVGTIGFSYDLETGSHTLNLFREISGTFGVVEGLNAHRISSYTSLGGTSIAGDHWMIGGFFPPAANGTTETVTGNLYAHFSIPEA